MEETGAEEGGGFGREEVEDRVDGLVEFVGGVGARRESRLGQVQFERVFRFVLFSFCFFSLGKGLSPSPLSILPPFQR